MRLRKGDTEQRREKPAAGGAGEDVEQPVLPPGLQRFWITAFAGAAGVLLVVFVIGSAFWILSAREHVSEQLRGCSAMLVRDLGNRVAALQGRLREWGSDPRLREVLQAGDPGRLRAREEALARQIPNALRVHLVPTGDLVPRTDAQPLSYAGLDLIHQAERRGRVTPVEVHRLGLPDEHLAVAAPVLEEGGKGTVGVIHVALPLSLLPAAGEAGGDWGRILFQQQVGDAVASVAPADANLPKGRPDHVIDVPGTRLRVVAWTTRDSIFDSGLLLWAGLGWLLAAGLVALALWLPARALKAALASDYAGVVAIVEDALQRRPMRQVRYRLAETYPVVQVLSRLMRPLARGGPSEAPADTAWPTPQVPPTPESGAEASEAELPVSAGSESTATAVSTLAPEQVPEEIFRAYDIRGIVGIDLSEALMRELGRSIATEALEAHDSTVMVARDTRPSGKGLSAALIEGLRASGCDVVDLGEAPTPLLYYAAQASEGTAGVMVTASHNPAEYNGLKVIIRGVTLGGERIQALRRRILEGTLAVGDGSCAQDDLTADYIGQIEQDVAIARNLRLVVDCGNGAASLVAPELYRTLGCDVVELNCDPAAGFPNGRVPDPARPECMAELAERVVAEGADLGLAFDADGDRLGVVDSSGKIIWPDRLLMLLAADVLSRHPGADVIYDVKCSRHLATEILRNGGRPVMWRSGHAPLKAKMQEDGALLAGEWSGHILFGERWNGSDDAPYAGARVLEVLALDPRPSDEIFAELPEAAFSLPELHVSMAEGEPARVMAAVLERAGRITAAQIKTLDGVRAETPGAWGLVRASNTQPALTFRFEADSEEELARIQDLFRELVNGAAPDLALPF